MKVTIDKEFIIYGHGLLSPGDEVDIREKDIRCHLGKRCHEGWDSELVKKRKPKKRKPKPAATQEPDTAPEGEDD